ncbi:MAG: dihydrofolate reductase family protein [Candidatus Dojkabacteria bacterium]
MRKIIASEMISIDGFFAGEDGNIDWHTVDDDFNKFAVEFEKTVDTILFGRKTYQMFESYWPTALKDPATGAEDIEIAKFIEDAKKVVLSKTLDKLTWNNSVLIKDNIKEEIEKLKNEDGNLPAGASAKARDIVIYGSGSVVAELTNLGLIDEYLFIISPTILGKGVSLFKDISEKISLKLIETRKFENGNVMVIYKK